MRVLNASAGDGDDSHGHGHSHGRSHAPAKVEDTPSEGKSTSVKAGNVKKRKTAGAPTSAKVNGVSEPVVNPSLKLSAYLNLFGDFTHNITDGLAMAASFYSSPQLGAVTTIATFCHEIPHEVSTHLKNKASIAY